MLMIETTEGYDSLLSVVIWIAFSLAFLFKRREKVVLKKGHTYYFPLIEKELLNHDTRRFRFALPSSDHVLGLPVGQHIILSAEVNGKVVQRPYTPISTDIEKGYFELVIKIYYPNTHPEYPEGGKLTHYLDNMRIGDIIAVSGPFGKITYVRRNRFHLKRGVYAGNYRRVNDEVIVTKKVGMIAGGSGITPMFQLIKHVLSDPSDDTELWLLFANQSKLDVVFMKELNLFSAKYTRFHVWYTVDTVEDSTVWEYDVGLVTPEVCQAHLPPPEDSVILLCGPPVMIDSACLPYLKQLGYDSSRIFTF
ncbi:hypothetical protein Zmor_028538 [Zophobas morio]|uniref:NADH-cytochrome b5 reductase n=1 Tax=Zophobas morio TaxID=2755281 RepID=A0AA38HKZ8_9CUCU|nr:hypothetical protein Zmor_028538 [Zophobas morio]